MPYDIRSLKSAFLSTPGRQYAKFDFMIALKELIVPRAGNARAPHPPALDCEIWYCRCYPFAQVLFRADSSGLVPLVNRVR